VKRRVVGQVLDYAAALWGTPLAAVESAFTSLEGSSPFEQLRSVAPEGWDEALCRDRASGNLERGAFRLLVAVDEVNDGLRRIIEYVNVQPGALRLVALEFPFYTDGQTQVLVPETYGDEMSPPGEQREGESVADALVDQPPGVHELHAILTARLVPRLTRLGESISYKTPDGQSVLHVRLVPDHRVYLQDVERFGITKAELQQTAQESGFVTGGTWIQRPEDRGQGERLGRALQPLLDRLEAGSPDADAR
jgi:hypothetical protein